MGPPVTNLDALVRSLARSRALVAVSAALTPLVDKSSSLIRRRRSFGGLSRRSRSQSGHGSSGGTVDRGGNPDSDRNPGSVSMDGGSGRSHSSRGRSRHGGSRNSRSGIATVSAGGQAQSLGNSVEEAGVAPNLGHVPHHDAAKAGEGLGIFDDVGQVVARNVTNASSRRSTGDTNENLDVRVLADSLGPVVPGAEVKIVLVAGTELEGVNTAVVVVELHSDNVEGHVPQKIVVSEIREGALRSRAQ